MKTLPLLAAIAVATLSLSACDNKPIQVNVTKAGKIYIGETEVEMDRLVTLLTAMTNNDPERRVFIRGDQKLGYGQVMEVIGAINKGGFRKVALISDPSK